MIPWWAGLLLFFVGIVTGVFMIALLSADDER